MRGRERGRHARRYTKRERDERVGVHRNGTERGKGRAVKPLLVVRVGARVHGVHASCYNRDRLRGVAEECPELVANNALVSRKASMTRACATYIFEHCWSQACKH